MKSLQGRMLLALGITIIFCWVLAIAALVVYLTDSQSSIRDGRLQTIGTKILLAIPTGKQLSGSGPGLQLREKVINKNDELAFQVWVNKKKLVVQTPGSPATPLRGDFAEGFTNSIINGMEWRVFTISDSAGKYYVQVATPRSSINRELSKKLFIALGITTMMLLLVGGLMHFAVKKALAPVVTIGEALHNRKKFDLTPLPITPLPSELHPLIDSFNHLLLQLNEAVDGERKFIGDAAHELRTPLSALQAHGQIALRAETITDKDAAITKLLTVAVRSTRLSEQLLDLARLNAGFHGANQSLADLSELVLHVVREFEVQAKQNNRSIEVDTKSCVIACDVDEIGILLRNLLDNALRYTSYNGTVRVKCGYVSSDIYLEVADDGCGVPESEQTAIFQRFHRVPGNGGRGSGIGLSLVAGIAELHQATIKTGMGLKGRGFSVRIIFPAPKPEGQTELDHI